MERVHDAFAHYAYVTGSHSSTSADATGSQKPYLFLTSWIYS